MYERWYKIKYKEKIEDTVHVVESKSFFQQVWFQKTKFSHELGADYTFEIWYSYDPASGSWQERKTDSYDKLGVKVTYKGETISWQRDFKNFDTDRQKRFGTLGDKFEATLETSFFNYETSPVDPNVLNSCKECNVRLRLEFKE